MYIFNIRNSLPVDTDFSSLPGFIRQIQDFSSLDVLPVAFSAVFTLSRLSFYGQLLEQLNVALLSRPTVFLIVTHCYCYTVGK